MVRVSVQLRIRMKMTVKARIIWASTFSSSRMVRAIATAYYDRKDF